MLTVRDVTFLLYQTYNKKSPLFEDSKYYTIRGEGDKTGRHNCIQLIDKHLEVKV